LVPFKHTFGEAMSSSPWGRALGQGDVDVAAPALERGGDVIIAPERALDGDEDVTTPVPG
jgi:hypothetical protein